MSPGEYKEDSAAMSKHDQQRSVYIPPGDAAMESYRLSTFMKYPQDTPVNPRHLAAAGFHYTGYKDRVKCFCCGLCVENWCVGDDVKSPRWHRSNCEFILGQDCGNQPIGGLFGNFMRPSGSTGAGGDLFRDFGRQGSQNISVQQVGALPSTDDMPSQTSTDWKTFSDSVSPQPTEGDMPEQTARVVEPTRPASQYQAEVAKQQEQVNKFMLGDLVKSATEMGFETSVIRRVVKRRLTSGGNLYTSVADLVDDITANENEPNSDDDDETNTSQPSQTTTVKTPGFTELPTNESMETEISIPPDVTPSMEARIRELQEERKCKICLDKVADIVFVPCGHLCTCTECAEALRKCPICRSKIERGIKTYMS
ncbi:baculoviral IAP repeat-containing protein 8-like isoform X3 [Ciona intestinalis]